jgi:uncharacterized protein YggU (UPF0235/DUF167 family)
MPRSPKNVVGGIRDGRVIVRVTSPPVDQAANDAVVRMLANALGLPKGAVRLVAGHTARNKVAEAAGLSLDAVADLLREPSTGRAR